MSIPVYDSNLSRRELLSLLGLAGFGSALGIMSCTTKSGRAPVLRFYGTGTLDILAEGWDRLQRETGIALEFTDNGNDTGPVIAQMIAGTAASDYDLGGLQGGAERELAEAGAIIPWNDKFLPKLANLWEIAKSIPYTQVGSERYGIPIALNADSMIYRADLLRTIPGYESGSITSYAAIFDERLRGRTSMEDAWINSAIFTAIYLKESGGTSIGDPGNLTETELTDVMNFLIERKKSGQFRKFWRGWEQGVEIVASGDVFVMTGWEPIVYELERRGIEAKYAVPTEGYEGWSNDLILHVGTQTRGLTEAAHIAANWLLSGFYGCRLAELRGYAVPTDDSTSNTAGVLGCDALKAQGISEHVKRKFKAGDGTTYWQNVRPDNYRLYEEWWSKLRNA